VSIDDRTDAPLSAIAALVRGALLADFGAGIVVVVYEDPRALDTVHATKLPGLCIYRASERRRRRNSVDLVRDVTVSFDYVLPATPLENRNERWPALQEIWNAIADVVIAGKHAAVSSGDPVLSLAGVNVEQENSAQATYGFADGGGKSYPFFRGQIVIAHTPEGVNVDDLDDFLRFYASFDAPGGDHTSPLIEATETLPAYGESETPEVAGLNFSVPGNSALIGAI
jgi:hypothetical protein